MAKDSGNTYECNAILHVGDRADECYLTVRNESRMITFTFSDTCYAIDLDSLAEAFVACGREMEG